MDKDMWDWKREASEFLQAMLQDSDTKGFVIGLSGGVDSAVCASLAVDAVGYNNVFGVMLPIHSSEDTLVDAKELAKNLKINYTVANFYDEHKSFTNRITDTFPDSHTGPVQTDKANGNMKARFRMTALYAYAELMGYLVLGTGNKSELLIGYATKYGDGGVDCEPLGRLYKSQVYELARSYPEIPQNTIDKAPSADLWGGQTDEQELGFTYDELEVALRLLRGEGLREDSPVEMVSCDVIKKVDSLMNKNLHKINVPPSGPWAE